MTKAIVPVRDTDNIVTAEERDWYYREREAALKCAEGAASLIVEWWVHQYTIASNKLWRAEFSTQEEWVDELLFDANRTVVGTQAIVRRATFYAKMTAIRQLEVRGISSLDGIRAMVNAPGATIAISKMPKDSNVDFPRLIGEVQELNYKEAMRRIMDETHLARHWTAQVKYDESRWVCWAKIISQEWERKEGEWSFKSPEDSWVELKPVDPDMLVWLVSNFLKFNGHVELVKGKVVLD
jgi:hypothetical protein